jgi:hypothetical protein
MFLRLNVIYFITVILKLFEDTVSSRQRNVRCQVLATASVKITVFWDVTPCSPQETDKRFTGAYFFFALAVFTLNPPPPSSFRPAKCRPCLTCSYFFVHFFERAVLISLIKEVVKTSDRLVNFYLTTRRDVPKDSHRETRCLNETGSAMGNLRVF